MHLETLNDNAIRVTLYFFAAGCCLAAGVVERRRTGPGRVAWTWWLLAIAVLILGLGRELELGSAITDRGRSWSRTQGWYPDRRPLQRWADLAVLLAGTLALVVLAAILGRRARTQLPAFCVLVLLAMFVGVRAISYHDVDQLLYNHPWHGLRLNAAIEIGLTLAMAASALWAVRRSSGERTMSGDSTESPPWSSTR